jgi:SAM-dependent methyltransferase
MPEASARACSICGGSFDLAILATERMFGLGGEFWYDQCADCECLQLRNVPADLSRFYPADYYALTASSASATRSLYRRVRDAVLVGRLRHIGTLLAPVLPQRMAEVRQWVRASAAGRDARILDVGCGVGLLPQRLADQGFHRVEGVDPFVARDVMYRGRRLVQRGTIDDVAGEFDLIMFHHSLEHIADQVGVLTTAARLLAPNGRCLIRIPTVSSAAWEAYRECWVQLDAPRHLYLHSVTSLSRLAQLAGLRVERVTFDSTSLQFEGSEHYRRGGTLGELSATTFTRSERREFSRRARRLNAIDRGDQAAFLLCRDTASSS